MAGSISNAEKMREAKKLEEIIYPDIEPGIINKSMIEEAYLEDDYQGEMARLHQMEPIVYDRIKSLRLEFKNILRIDHLWILPNLTKLSLNCNKIETIEHIDMLTSLKQLDLSFNYIEKIENLEKLVNLEELSLFSNLITKIENLDSLEKLIILSIGDNQIDSLSGIERFRFFKNLSVLNLEGNPIAKKPDLPFNIYIAAVLPNLKYYDYVMIKDEMREEGKEKFSRELREIETNEELEIVERERVAKEERDAERLSSSFVEHLNEHQLYESLWKGDEDGRILMMIGQGATDLAEEYDKDIFDITQEIYKFGLEKYEEREIEIREFMSNLEEGSEEVQIKGQKIIEDFLVFKEQLFEEAMKILRPLERRLQVGDDTAPEVVHLTEQFDKLSTELEDAINVIWQQLMGQELHLHESIEEATLNFQRKIQEMMAKFVEQIQAYFSQLRDIALHFSENMTEAVSHFIATKLALQDFEGIPPELRNCMEDRDVIMNLLAGMKDTHVQRIDEREDRLAVRSREFIEKIFGDLNKNELDRNRAKILEINSFLDFMSESLTTLQMEIREEMLNEEQ